MNARQFLPLVLVLFIILVSCNGQERILIKKDGIWRLGLARYVTYFNGAVTAEDDYQNPGSFQFFKDGQARYTTDTSGVEMSWSYDEENEQITLISSNEEYLFDILESTDEDQVWQEITVIPVNASDTIMEEIRWNLYRVD